MLGRSSHLPLRMLSQVINLIVIHPLPWMPDPHHVGHPLPDLCHVDHPLESGCMTHSHVPEFSPGMINDPLSSGWCGIIYSIDVYLLCDLGLDLE